MLIKWGSIVVNGRGKLGGHVFSKNRGGNYVRTNQTPTNPRTVFQQSGRGVFTQLTQNWSSISDAERTSWNNAVENFTKTDVFGDQRKLSGKSLYVSLNKERLLMGDTIINTAPTPQDIFVPDFLGIQWDRGGQNITVQINLVGGGQNFDRVVLTATPVVSDGTTFIANKLVVLETGTDIANAGDLYQTYIERFGEPALGNKVFFGVYTINGVGQRSAPLNVRSNVQNA